jgi:prepilin-type N-terminal cleavage/methylation domain-containing protein
MPPGAQRGFQLIELIVATAVAAVALLLGAPPLARVAGQLQLRLAAEEVVGSMRQSRAYAIRHASKVGLKFRSAADGTVYWAIHRDGDADGVRSADIDDGSDPRVAPERAFVHFGRRVRFGFPPGQTPVDPSDPRRKLDRLDDPVRFNRSDIASFSPLDGATPGSVYLTDGVRHLLCVRIDHRSGRARILTWLPDERRWR